LELPNNSSSLKGGDYFAIRTKKNGKLVSTKIWPLMHRKQVSYFFTNWGNLLGKAPENKRQLLPFPKTGEVLHGTYSKPIRFYPICKNPT